MITSTSTLEDVCFAVAEALERHGFSAVLSGGSAATMYAPHGYASLDADFVLDPDEPLAAVAAALGSIGFARNRRSKEFVHSETRFTVEFPRGPLAVGAEYVSKTAVLVGAERRLRILTPTDSVRDRLAAFYFWDDFSALNVAVAAATARFEEVDMSAILSWTERESPELLSKYREFERRLRAKRPRLISLRLARALRT